MWNKILSLTFFWLKQNILVYKSLFKKIKRFIIPCIYWFFPPNNLAILDITGARTKFRNDDFSIYNHDCFYYYIRCLYFLFITFLWISHIFWRDFYIYIFLQELRQSNILFEFLWRLSLHCVLKDARYFVILLWTDED